MDNTELDKFFYKCVTMVVCLIVFLVFISINYSNHLEVRQNIEMAKGGYQQTMVAGYGMPVWQCPQFCFAVK